METIGVIGAGLMGRGVAQNLAQKGYSTTLVDVSPDILECAYNEIYNNIRFQALYKSKDQLESISSVLSRISFTTDYLLLNNVDFVIENVTENWDVKREIYLKLNGICSENCIFFANTSCISITKIGSMVKKPSRVIGTHFMNPVDMMNTVEIILGFHTSADTIEKTKRLLEKMDKGYIIVNDYPGFVSNRISHLFINEAVFVVQDQVASPQDVDEIFKKCYGHKMGPLETADLIGLDTVVNSLDVLFGSYNDTKFRCCPLLRKMVHAGQLGRKSGQGFYSY